MSGVGRAASILDERAAVRRRGQLRVATGFMGSAARVRGIGGSVGPGTDPPANAQRTCAPVLSVPGG